MIFLPVRLDEATMMALEQQKVDATLGDAVSLQVEIPSTEAYVADLLTRFVEGRQLHFYREGDHLVYVLTKPPVDLWYPKILPTPDFKEEEETYDH